MQQHLRGMDPRVWAESAQLKQLYMRILGTLRDYVWSSASPVSYSAAFIGRGFRLVLKRASVFLWTGLWSKITEKKSGSAQIWLSYVHANSTITTITTTFSNLMCNSTKQYCYKSHIKTYSQNYLKVAHRLDNNSLWRSLNLKLVNNAISWDFSSLGPNSLQNILGVVYQDKICQVR